MTVKINNIKETTATLIDPQGVVVGQIESQLQLDDIRIQIKKQKISGYTIKWTNYLITIFENGHLSEWPFGFFDITDLQLEELLDCNSPK